MYPYDAMDRVENNIVMDNVNNTAAMDPVKNNAAMCSEYYVDPMETVKNDATFYPVLNNNSMENINNNLNINTKKPESVSDSTKQKRKRKRKKKQRWQKRTHCIHDYVINYQAYLLMQMFGCGIIALDTLLGTLGIGCSVGHIDAGWRLLHMLVWHSKGLQMKSRKLTYKTK